MTDDITPAHEPVKKCTLCGEQFGLQHFYKAPGCKDGYAAQCKVCVKIRARKRQIVRAEYIRAYDRERSKLPHRIEAKKARFIEYVQKHPERRAAHNALNNAVREGHIHKMDCAFCGDGKTVAHHHDYSKPLEVTWLCHPCHHRFHALEAMATYDRMRA